MTPTLYLFFGPQGSGKSTQGQRLAEKLGLPFFDTGHELRELAKEKNATGRELDQAMKKGELVDDHTLQLVISQYLARHNVSRGMVMDGYPRTLEECQTLNKLADYHEWQILVIYITVSDQTVTIRITKRAVSENRADDASEIVAKRLETFKRETVPVIDYYRSNGRLLEIDGEPPVDQVTVLLYAALNINE